LKHIREQLVSFCRGKSQAAVVRCWEETRLSPTVTRIQEKDNKWGKSKEERREGDKGIEEWKNKGELNVLILRKGRREL
jgi:hypothetical protein